MRSSMNHAETTPVNCPYPVVALGLVWFILVIGGAGCGGPSPTRTPPPLPTATPSPTLVQSIALATAMTPTPTVTSVLCDGLPVGWAPYTVRAGDTLARLAAQYGISLDAVSRVNCLTSSNLQTGQTLYLPTLPTATPCPVPPLDWMPYVVQVGDTLLDLAVRTGISVDRILQANCLASTNLRVGQQLFLPPLPAPTPTPCIVRLLNGWQPYTVRAGDTLLELAVAGNTSVTRLMEANCLDSPMIRTGEALYVPAGATSVMRPSPVIPAAPGGLPPVPTRSPVPQAKAPCRGLNCPDGRSVANWTLPVGGPADPTFVPCRLGVSDAIDTENDLLEVGQWRLFFVCPTVSGRVTVMLPNGTSQNLDLLDSRQIADRQINMGGARAVLEWRAYPIDPVGEYILTLSSGAGPESRSFWVETPGSGQRYILADPVVVARNSSLDVYYVGFDLNQVLSVELYRQVRQIGPDREFTYIKSWQVPITQTFGSAVTGKGWARLSQDTLDDDVSGVYAIGLEGRSVYTYFWLR